MRGSISAAAQTTHLKPLEQHMFEIVFTDMEPCPLRYELTDYNSGTIDSNGLYTAPDREGSFEIRITCAENPDIGTYAYADVRN